MIKILGSQGSVSQTGRGSSFLITPTIAIDAGNLLEPLGEASAEIEHLFITHTHSDHIIDLPFLMTSYNEKRTKTLKIYGLKETISTLRAHLFNSKVWPDFTQIMLENGLPSIQYVTIDFDQSLYIDEVQLTPIHAVHIIPTCGFHLKTPKENILISGDTYENNALIDRVNANRDITTLIVDVSFCSSKYDIAKKSQHLTPKLLAKMLKRLVGSDLKIYTYHHKPLQEDLIDKELEAMGIFKSGGKRLGDGDVL
ncbi:MAG: MBL fold metallo-hydrolase [Campylobacterota bacterium]|nr:MBL fold metallo-hydrolase [Campylobacterota bacterium]